MSDKKHLSLRLAEEAADNRLTRSQLNKLLLEASERNEQLEAVVEKLPHTKDNKPVCMGDTIFLPIVEGSNEIIEGVVRHHVGDSMHAFFEIRIAGEAKTKLVDVRECYSTRKAALAASKETGKPKSTSPVTSDSKLGKSLTPDQIRKAQSISPYDLSRKRDLL